MKTYHEDTTLVQTSELRTHLDEILKQLSKTPVVLEKHHKPVAVLIDPQKYAKMEEMIETIEDILFALEARERQKKVRRKDYIPLEVVEKHFLK